ncbi:MAG: RidA family protein [Anaerolineae bacterium]|nr:RidA family protein [Gemmatimonadaceae bacterium]
MPADWLPITLDPKYQAPKGAYSPGVRAGDLLFVSGQIPTDPVSGEILGDDIETQTVLVLKKLSMVLEAGGAKLDDVVSVTVYLASADDWTAFNDVYKRTFKPPYPARAVVGAQLRGILVEVSAIAKVS